MCGLLRVILVFLKTLRKVHAAMARKLKMSASLDCTNKYMEESNKCEIEISCLLVSLRDAPV